MTDLATSSIPYDLLHPAIQRWVWDQGWPALRPVQDLAIPHVLAAESDVLITAGTAGGKTEAAWLPIASRLAFDTDEGTATTGVKALYIGPLKALINDQAMRLQTLFERIDLPVARRHGDISGAERDRVLTAPEGIVMLTPESLEAMFMLEGHRMPTVFAGLRYVVVDELHAFIGSERGAQLQSLLHRMELAIRRRVPRIALSATIADPGIATRFLRPEPGAEAIIVTPPAGSGTDLQMQLRAYETESNDLATSQGIVDHIYGALRGTNNLVFANSRRKVEAYATALRAECERNHVPNEFFPHHGSLAKPEREDVERRLKSREGATTAICTSTLEMGIDIGSVTSIGQIGSPGNAASLRQRLGRSGRRGDPAILRVYLPLLQNPETAEDTLQAELVESIALLSLLLEHWLEPPNTANLHLSTLVQQVLSVIAQHGGARADDLYSALCQHGPFAGVDQAMFVALLRALGEHEILMQSSEGLLLAAPGGEKLSNAYEFYTAFTTDEEYRLVADGRELGTLPIAVPLAVGGEITFAGRTWQITAVHSREKVIELQPTAAGAPPEWEGTAIAIDAGVRTRMREILAGTDVPPFLTPTAERALKSAQNAWRDLNLDSSSMVGQEETTLLFPWTGDRQMATIALMLNECGIETRQDRMSLGVKSDPAAIRRAIDDLLGGDPPDAVALAELVADKTVEKHDVLLSDALQCAAVASRDLDVAGALAALRSLPEFASKK